MQNVMSHPPHEDCVKLKTLTQPEHRKSLQLMTTAVSIFLLFYKFRAIWASSS